MITIPTDISAEKPVGAPFIIDSCPFRPGEQFDYAVLSLDDDKVLDWPMVYILANDKAAYVGQTNSVATRMNQHGANEEKSEFTTANVIFNEEFNTSVITDYEHRLIGYMHADGRYVLTNKNDGMTDSNYFSKESYAKMFEELWDDLRKLELADHTIAQIEESEVFKYSPFKSLNADQRVALDKIYSEIERGLESSEPIVVEGMPGTGKTILAIYLLKLLKDDPRYSCLNVRIVEPVTSLRNTLRKALKGVSGLSPDDVISPSDLVKPSFGYRPGEKKCFDVVLVDEAHKLKQRVNLGTQYKNYDDANRKLGLPQQATQLDWVIDQAKLPIFFYDPLQSIGPSCIASSVWTNALGESARFPIRLDCQMRVKGGDSYLRYVKDILEGTCSGYQDFEGYDLVLHEDPLDFAQCFERDYQAHNLTRMVAGCAWKWVSKKDKAAFDIELDGVSLRWNCTYDNWVGRGVDDSRIAHEVGCIHSIQGYDLSYAYVLIGNDLSFDEDAGKPVSNKASYFDRNGYATATKQELDRFIKNIYYVLLTRGILGTHVYVLDPSLREYLKRYFPTR